MSREGGTVRVVPGTADEGVQNRPPRTKSPSRYRSTLRRRLGEPVAGLSSRFGGRNCLWRVEMSALCLELVVRVCRIALQGPKHPPEREKWKKRHLVQNRPPGAGSPSRAEKVTKTPSRVA